MSLFTPGPVNVSGEARNALGLPEMHHRSIAFSRTMGLLTSRLKDAFFTGGEVVTLTSSGTGAMEAAVANLLSPGERALVPTSGKFSRRWAEICRAYGVGVEGLDLPPGKAPEPDMIASALDDASGIRAVLLTHCETSTGSLTDLEAVCRTIHDVEKRRGEEVLAVADCITTLCVDELRTDRWGIDCAVAASQKGLLSPPGLAFVSLSPRAQERVRAATSSRYYFDLRRYLGESASQAGGQTPGQADSGKNAGPPFTPAIHLVAATLASLSSLEDLGLESVWQANRSGARAIRLLGEAAGLEAVAERQASGVVAFRTGDLDPERIAGTLSQEHGIIVARGQAELAGKVIRVSPIGKGPAELRRFARALADVLGNMGRALDMEAIESDFRGLLEDCAIWG